MPIVVGVSERAEGRAALERGIAEARLRGAPLHLVHLAGPAHPENPAVARRAAEDKVQSELELDEIVRRCEAEGVQVTTHVRSQAATSVAAVLLEQVDETGADLVVIGLRQRSRVGKLIMGSVAQEILLNAPCPVLCVPATT